MNKVSDPPVIVELLQADIRGEHAAIMQYLQHAYRLAAGELPGDVEEIAREEMRHFRWLCEMVVELGGSPTIERNSILLDAPSETDLLRLDIDAEDRAIAQYQDHIARIDHPKVVRLLERILADELAHRQEFGGLVEELGGEPAGTQAAGVGPWGGGPTDAELALEAPAAEAPAREIGPFGGDAGRADQSNVGVLAGESVGSVAGDDADRAVWDEGSPADRPAGDRDGANRPGSMPGQPDEQPDGWPIAPNVRLINRLNADVRAEYAAILRQLHLSFTTRDPRLSKELLESHAQWHMTLMGWLSERVRELGGTPTTDHDPVSATGDTRRWLSDELRQQGAHVARIEGLRDETEDPETRVLLGRIQIHDAHATDQLHDLLAQVDEEPMEPRPTSHGLGRLTVGGLLGQRQP